MIFSHFRLCCHFFALFFFFFSPSTEREDESFVGGSQKISGPPPAQPSPEIPLLGPQSGKAVTPLDLGRFQSKVFRSVLNEMRPKDNTGTPQEAGGRNPPQKEASVQLDTPSRFLSRDQLFRPSFNVKVLTEWGSTDLIHFLFFCLKTKRIANFPRMHWANWTLQEVGPNQDRRRTHRWLMSSTGI